MGHARDTKVTHTHSKRMKLGSTKRTTAAKQKVIAVYASGLLHTHAYGVVENIQGGQCNLFS